MNSQIETDVMFVLDVMAGELSIIFLFHFFKAPVANYACISDHNKFALLRDLHDSARVNITHNHREGDLCTKKTKMKKVNP